MLSLGARTGRVCKTAPHVPQSQPLTCQRRAGWGEPSSASRTAFASGWRASFGVAGLRARKSGWRQSAATPNEAAPPPPTALLPKEKQLLSQWPRAGAVLQARLVRAQRKSNGEALGKALPQKRAGPHAGSERKVIDHKPFSSAASPMACERGVILTFLSPSKA